MRLGKSNGCKEFFMSFLPRRNKPFRGEQRTSVLFFFYIRGRLLRLDVTHERAGLPRQRDFAGMRIQSTLRQ